MKFNPLPTKGAYVIELERRGDERGFFARLFCEREFADAGLITRFVQINNSMTSKKGTLRGMHYQLMPTAEVKIVRCIRGALFDVILDLRPDSPTFGKWYGTELNEDNRRMMYVPGGFAHAILTVTEDVEAVYLVSDFYSPEDERGVRWDDPTFRVEWPIDPVEISQKDRSWPDFNHDFHGLERLRGLK
jgi:dTDP-4-dehydrorhamnose 3,5-epimerase